MAFSAGKEASEEDFGSGIVAEINITPLTDIFLVLLIIFMVTSSVMSQLGVDVQLPQAQSASSAPQPGAVILTVLPDGGLRINDAPVKSGDWPSFEASMKAALLAAKNSMVILEGDRRVLLGNAIELMDHARRAGAQKFAIATQPGGD